MATNQDIVDRAGYELGMIASGESLSTTDSTDALNALNDMMHEWAETDKDFNWFTQDTIGDTAPIPKWAQSGIISNLAVRLGAVFSIAISRELAVKADYGDQVITARLINMKLKNTDMSHLPQGNWRYNIETDA